MQYKDFDFAQHRVLSTLDRTTLSRATDMCGLRTRQLADADPQTFLDLRTNSGSLLDENLRTRTETDPVP